MAASIVQKERRGALHAPVFVGAMPCVARRAARMPPLQRKFTLSVLGRAIDLGASAARRLWKFREPLQRALAVFLVALLSSVVTGCSQSPVSIEKQPPVIKTEYFDKGARPPEANTPEHNECANTHWDFGCSPELSWDLVKRERAADGENVVLKITKVKIPLKLEITMWLPEKATEDVVAHEKGHAAICIDAYKQADAVARDAATNVIGKEIVAHGADFEATIKSALTNVYQDIARRYREETVDKANITSGLYDRMTMKDHAASKVESKVSDAELEYEHLSPALKKQRAEEERLLRTLVEKYSKNRKQDAKPDEKPDSKPASKPASNP